MGSFLKLKNFLEENTNFTLICHVEPDGDAIGALVAFSAALQNKKKQPVLVCRDHIPGVFNFLADGIDITEALGGKEQNIILLDNGDFRRTGFVEELRLAKTSGAVVSNIDHHPKNDLWRFANINYSDEKASSTCEIVYRIMLGLGWEITPTIATALLAGIYNDTGGLKHSNTTQAVFSVVADLLRRGAKLKKITENIEYTKTVKIFKLWGIALARLRFNNIYQLSTSALTREDLMATGTSEDDISGLVNLLNSAPESKAALLLYECEDGKIKGSLRTERENVDVARIAKAFGGGGHKKAAGFTISGRIEIKGDKWKIV